MLIHSGWSALLNVPGRKKTLFWEHKLKPAHSLTRLYSKVCSFLWRGKEGIADALPLSNMGGLRHRARGPLGCLGLIWLWHSDSRLPAPDTLQGLRVQGLLFKKKIIFNCRIIALQYCVGFCWGSPSMGWKRISRQSISEGSEFIKNKEQR